MIVNPVAALRCAQRRVDYHRQTDRKAPKQTKDYSDNLKVSYFNSRASRSTAEVGLPFMHKAHQLERVTCIREIYKSPVIRLQSGLRDFFFQNAVKNRNIACSQLFFIFYTGFCFGYSILSDLFEHFRDATAGKADVT